MFCSAEETCYPDLKCPTSISKGVAPADPVSFTVVKELYSGQAVAGKKLVKTAQVKKAVNTDDTNDMNLAYAGFKTHEEEAYPGDLFLAFRCSAGSVALCAQLPYE